ncbi:hypothetical protein [Salinisphaera sp. G21_0]|uniref:hypothetical protein n=1 Tax=Salinisphaera sp. G21_0 TaxID=2821094 RepID=UPI001AD9C2C2|nr:hypothetical protein [Salinisphaera sp. G21_0]MBO9480229.1 hypothetical protein [Salinisphaera sp. G21_0]
MQEAVTTAGQGKFGHLDTTVVTGAPATIRQVPGFTYDGNMAESRKRPLSDISVTELAEGKRVKTGPSVIGSNNSVNIATIPPYNSPFTSGVSGKYSSGLTGSVVTAQKRPGDSMGDPLLLASKIAKILAEETEVLPANNEQLCLDTIKAQTVAADLIFRKMIKPNIENPESTPVPPVAYFRRADGTLDKVDFTESGNTLKEVTGITVFENYFFSDYHLNWGRGCTGLYDPNLIYAGQLDNGMFFLHALKPEMCDQLFTLDTANQQIHYLGNDDFTPESVKLEDHFALYFGTSYGEAMAAFELACKDTDIAKRIRPLLGWSDAIGIMKGHQPRVLGLQAEAMEMSQVVPDPDWEMMVDWDE